MASRRFNAKLLIIIGVGLACAGTAVGVTWFLTRSNVHALLDEAKAAEKAGDYELAIDLYGKTVKHPRFSRDADLLMKIASLHGRMPVSSSRLAQYHLKYRLAWLRQIWRINPGDDRAFQQEMNILMRLGIEVRRATSWDEMFARTDEILGQYPHMTAALKYRGISQVNRMSLATSNLSQEERLQTLSDLKVTLRERPDDRQTILHLARWHVMEAMVQNRARVDVDKVEKLRDEAVALTGHAVQQHPDDVQQRIDHVSVLLSLNRHEAMVPHADMLYHQLGDHPGGPLVTTNVVQLLLKHHGLMDDQGTGDLPPSLLNKAVSLVQASQIKHPESPLLMLVLARLRQHEGEITRAIALYEQAWKGFRTDTPLEYIVRFNTRSRAKVSSLSLQLDEAEEMDTGVQRNEQLETITQQLEEIKNQLGDVPGIRRLAGRISYARGDWTAAEQALEQFVTTAGAGDMRTLLQRAHTQRVLGHWGAASEQYEQILKRQPAMTAVRYELARVYLAAQRLDEAAEEIKRLYGETGQDDAVTQALELELLIRQENLPEAKTRVRSMAVRDARTGVYLAHLSQRAGLEAEARVLANQAFRADPADIAALAMVVQRTPDQAKQRAHVEQSRVAGVDEAVLDRITRYINGELDVAAAADTTRRDDIATEGNAAVRAARWYRYHAKRDEWDQARAALRKVDDLPVLEPVYLLACFDDALIRKDWEEAERLAVRARQARGGKGADYAKGRFYLGRLRMARRYYDQAATDFRAALEQRRTYSEGWTWLAEALLAMRDLNASQEAFRTAVDQKPDNVPALMGLAKVHTVRGEHGEALDLFRRAHEFHPDSFAIADIYLRFEADHGNIDRALKLREAIAQRDPENVANRKALAMIMARKGLRKEAMRQVRLMGRSGADGRDTIIAEARVIAAGGDRQGSARRLIEFARASTDGTGQDHFVVAQELARMGLEADAISGYRRAVDRGGTGQPTAMRELAELLLRTPGGSAEAQKLYRQLWNMDRLDLQVGCAYARILVIGGEFERAQEVKDALLASHGRNVDTLVLSAQVAVGRGLRVEAEASLDAAIKLAPQRAELYMGKAQLLRLDAIRHGDVLSLLDQALKLNPLLADAQALKAEIYDRRNEVNAAIREYETLLRLAPDHAARLRLSDLYREHGYAPQLKTLLDESAQRYPNSADWRRQQALFAQRQNNPRLALRHMKEAFKLRKNAVVLQELVLLLIQLEEAETAKKILRSNTVMLRRDPVLQALRARAVHMLGDESAAASFFKSALKQAADRHVFIETVAQVDATIGLEETLALVEEIHGIGSPVWVGLGVAALEGSAADYDAVVSRLSRLEYKIYRLALNDQASFYRMYGDALEKTGQLDLAVAAFDHLVRVDPENAEARHRLATILAKSDKEADRSVAVTQARQALALRPSDAQFMETVGWCLFRAGIVEEGRAAIQSSLRKQPTPRAYLHMAEVELSTEDGSHDYAITLLRSAARLAEQIEDSQILAAAARRLGDLGVRDVSDHSGMGGGFESNVVEVRPKTLRDMATRLLQGATLSVAILEESRDRWEGGQQDLETGFAYVGELILTDRHDEAELVFRQVQSEHGNSVYTHILAAQINTHGGAFAQAGLDIDAALRESPQWAVLYVAKARLAARDARRFEEALAQLDSALGLDPSLAAAQQLKGDIYRIRGEIGSAIQAYEALLRKAPKARRRLALAEMYFATGRRMAAKTLLEDSALLFPRSSVWPRQQALLAVNEGDGDLALRKMRMAFTRGKTASLLQDLVLLQLAAGHGEEALSTLRGHSDLATGDPVYHALQGRALMTQGQTDAAVVQFKVALSQAEGFRQFASVAEQIRLASGVGRAVDLATRVLGETVPTWAGLAIAVIQVAGGHDEAALERLDTLAADVAAMELDEQAQYHRARAMSLHHLAGRASAAEAAYAQWRALAPSDAAAVAGLGRLLAEDLARPAEAIRLLREARTRWPNDPMLLDVLGLALLLSDEQAEAREVFKERLRWRPGALANLYLAEIALTEGRRARAVELLNSARDLAEQTKDPQTLEAVNGHLATLESRRESTP